MRPYSQTVCPVTSSPVTPGIPPLLTLKSPHLYNEGENHAFLSGLLWGLNEMTCVEPRVLQSFILLSPYHPFAHNQTKVRLKADPRPSAPDLNLGPDGLKCGLIAWSVLLENMRGEEPWSQTPAGKVSTGRRAGSAAALRGQLGESGSSRYRETRWDRRVSRPEVRGGPRERASFETGGGRLRCGKRGRR